MTNELLKLILKHLIITLFLWTFEFNLRYLKTKLSSFPLPLTTTNWSCCYDSIQTNMASLLTDPLFEISGVGRPPNKNFYYFSVTKKGVSRVCFYKFIITFFILVFFFKCFLISTTCLRRYERHCY